MAEWALDQELLFVPLPWMMKQADKQVKDIVTTLDFNFKIPKEVSYTPKYFHTLFT